MSTRPETHTDQNSPQVSDKTAQAELIMRLRAEGIRDAHVLSVMEKVPRRLFLNARHQTQSLRDSALPIDCGQSISAPSVVALMTSALDLNPDCRVFELGTGSGYQAAILSHLSDQVFSTERYKTLIDLAEQRLQTLKINNVTVVQSDGQKGLPEKAPFDRIIVTAACPQVPKYLMEQLKSGGIMVLPLGLPGQVQKLVKIVRHGSRYDQELLCHVRFVPVCEGIAEKL